ncbi:hypothetical protein FMEAI12_3480003 [Parafrankia sp. Ea1.12]|nr:hypothetical protein FMEAI12_3480003 [Parafrankia sp. Ea1.12]
MSSMDPAGAGVPSDVSIGVVPAGAAACAGAVAAATGTALVVLADVADPAWVSDDTATAPATSVCPVTPAAPTTAVAVTTPVVTRATATARHVRRRVTEAPCDLLQPPDGTCLGSDIRTPVLGDTVAGSLRRDHVKGMWPQLEETQRGEPIPDAGRTAQPTRRGTDIAGQTDGRLIRVTTVPEQEEPHDCHPPPRHDRPGRPDRDRPGLPPATPAHDPPPVRRPHRGGDPRPDDLHRQPVGAGNWGRVMRSAGIRG